MYSPLERGAIPTRKHHEWKQLSWVHEIGHKLVLQPPAVDLGLCGTVMPVAGQANEDECEVESLREDSVSAAMI